MDLHGPSFCHGPDPRKNQDAFFTYRGLNGILGLAVVAATQDVRQVAAASLRSFEMSSYKGIGVIAPGTEFKITINVPNDGELNHIY